MSKKRQIDHEVKLTEIQGLEKIMLKKYNNVPQWERRLRKNTGRTELQKLNRPKSKYKCNETKIPKIDLSFSDVNHELESIPYGN